MVCRVRTAGPANADVSSDLSIVIPSLNRGHVLSNTIPALNDLSPRAREVIVVDQTVEHPQQVSERLAELASNGCFRHVRRLERGIPGAMNEGLRLATSSRVLFLDDDITPDANLVAAHATAGLDHPLVAGQVLQPGEVPETPSAEDPHRFNANAPRTIGEFMGGNFSIDRAKAMALGGFDENFVGAAYRFEAEFAARYVRRYGGIHFEPGASIRHLAIPTGGTRERAHHLRTASPHHSVGAYYYLLRARPLRWRTSWLVRPLRAIRTRHHLRRPWYIPVSLIAELRGMKAALDLDRSGPRYGFTPAEPA